MAYTVQAFSKPTVHGAFDGGRLIKDFALFDDLPRFADVKHRPGHALEPKVPLQEEGVSAARQPAAQPVLDA